MVTPEEYKLLVGQEPSGKPQQRTTRERIAALKTRCTYQEWHSFGRFTIVEALYKRKNGDVVSGFGLARCSDEDLDDGLWHVDRGYDIACHRAAKAVLYKLKGWKLSHPLMG